MKSNSILAINAGWLDERQELKALNSGFIVTIINDYRTLSHNDKFPCLFCDTLTLAEMGGGK